MFSVTHPFHPLQGQQFVLVQVRLNWGEERVYYLDANDRLRSIPLRWTSLAAPDPFVTIAAGRAYFRPTDLLTLSQLIREIHP
jgi:Family of unknown function (DUF5372)